MKATEQPRREEEPEAKNVFRQPENSFRLKQAQTLAAALLPELLARELEETWRVCALFRDPGA